MDSKSARNNGRRWGLVRVFDGGLGFEREKKREGREAKEGQRRENRGWGVAAGLVVLSFFSPAGSSTRTPMPEHTNWLPKTNHHAL